MTLGEKIILGSCTAGLALLLSPKVYYELNKPLNPIEPVVESSEPDRCDTGDPVVATASWYGEPFHGRKTASGEVFDKNALTVAHKSLPFGTCLIVEGPDATTVRVYVTDRGPYAAGRDLDLSEAAFEKIAPLSRGVIKVLYRESR